MPTEPHFTTVGEILSTSAHCWSDRPAVYDLYGERYSYRDLEVAAHEVAKLLMLRKVPLGSVVGITSPSAHCFLASLFAIMNTNCVAIPIPPNLSPAEQMRIMRASGVSWVIRETPVSDTPTERDARVTLFSGSDISLSASPETAATTVTSIFPVAAVMRHTSGTTGESKGVVLSHRAVLERTEVSGDLLGLKPGDVVLSPLSPSYHFIASALACVRAGATIIDCVDASAEELLALAEKHNATHIYASPEHYQLLNEVERSATLQQVRKAISTSGPLRADVAAAFEAKFSVRLTQVFGIIEVGLPLWNERSDYSAASLGVCKAPYECDVIDHTGHRVAVGEIGELMLRGPGMFSGYVLGSQQAHLHPAGSWFATGDLVKQNEDKTISFKGRKKSALTFDTVTIFPEEIEAVLQRAPEIKAVRVIESIDPELGRCLVAEVVITPLGTYAESRLRELCQKELPAHKVPKKFVLVDTLPMTGSGKVIRLASV